MIAQYLNHIIHNYKKIIIVIFFESICWTLGLPRSCAQQPATGRPSVSYTLDDVWAKLLVNSKKLAIAELTVKTYKEQLRDAKDERLPDIDLSGEYKRLSNLPEYVNGVFHSPQYYPIQNNTYSLGPSAYLNLYSGNKSNLKISSRATEVRIAEEQRKLTQAELKVLAAAYYLDLERSKIFKKLIDEDINDQERQLKKIRALQKNGVVLKSDVLRSELRHSRQRFVMIQVQNDIDIINQKLAVLTGIEEDKYIEPSQTFAPDTISLKGYEDYLQYAQENAFQIHIAQKKTELKAIDIKIDKSICLPRVGLFSDYKFSYPQGSFYPYSKSLYSFGGLGIRASWSISAFLKNPSKVKADQINLKSQEVYMEDLRDSVKTQVAEAYLRFKEAVTGIEVAQRNVAQVTENYRVLTNSYFNQTALITDLLDADTQKLQASFDLEASKMNAQLKYFQLQQIIGSL